MAWRSNLVVVYLVLALAGALAGVVDQPVTQRGDRGAAGAGVFSNLLSFLPTPVPDTDEDQEDDAAPKTDLANAAERGIYKKKKHFHYHHLWHTLYYWGWVFAVIVVKFKVALLLLWGHLTYFVVAFIRVLIREVPLWIQLKRDSHPPAPYPYSPYSYGAPAAPASQYGAYGSYGSYGPHKRRTGEPASTVQAAQDIAYSAQSK